jgi:hypothetical protein
MSEINYLITPRVVAGKAKEMFCGSENMKDLLFEDDE